VGKISPALARSQIETMLFTPQVTDSKALRLPRGIEQAIVKTDDGKLQAYQAGRGPTVVFVHGWDGGAYQFFPLMRGLARCGFSSLAFDHLGHGLSDKKTATLQQSINTCNQVLSQVQKSTDGLHAAVGHATGCIAIANASNVVLKDLPLLMIAPVFNYKLHVLKRLVKLGLPADMVKQYESAVADSINFCNRYPQARLMVSKDTDHIRIINSESVWQELKSHLNYDDTTINFSAQIIDQ